MGLAEHPIIVQTVTALRVTFFVAVRQQVDEAQQMIRSRPVLDLHLTISCILRNRVAGRVGRDWKTECFGGKPKCPALDHQNLFATFLESNRSDRAAESG